MKIRWNGCVCVRRKRVVELVIVRLERLGSNQAEIRPRVVPPAFWSGASSVALKVEQKVSCYIEI